MKRQALQRAASWWPRQHQIDLLLLEVSQLRRQGADEGQTGFRSLRDELPPLYWGGFSGGSPKKIGS